MKKVPILLGVLLTILLVSPYTKAFFDFQSIDVNSNKENSDNNDNFSVGNSTSGPTKSPYRFIVNPVIDIIPPTITYIRHWPTSPMVGQLTSIGAVGSDDYLLGNTKLYLDGVNVQTCDFTGRGFQTADCSFSTTTLGVGEHTYYAVVTDSVGNSTSGPTKSPYRFIVNPVIDIIPPTITYIRHWPTSPMVGQLTSIGAVGSDDYLLGNTKLYLDGVNVQTCDFTGRGFQTADCSFSTTTLGVGEHTYYAVVTDSVGNSTSGPTKSPYRFTVTE